MCAIFVTLMSVSAIQPKHCYSYDIISLAMNIIIHMTSYHML